MAMPGGLKDLSLKMSKQRTYGRTFAWFSVESWASVAKRFDLKGLWLKMCKQKT
jgi:hypothetical protein